MQSGFDVVLLLATLQLRPGLREQPGHLLSINSETTRDLDAVDTLPCPKSPAGVRMRYKVLDNNFRHTVRRNGTLRSP
ncbi:MAG: hypothetical protein ACMG6H_13955 [Acidobacteriota bacterium]